VPDDVRTGRNMLPDYVKTSVFFTTRKLYLFVSIDHCGLLLLFVTAN